jgi:hypothetical protein
MVGMMQSPRCSARLGLWLAIVALSLPALASATPAGSAGSAGSAGATAQPAGGAAYQVLLTPGTAWLLGPGGERLLELKPELFVALADPTARPDRRRRPLRGQLLRFPAWQPERRAGGRFLLRTELSAGPLRYRLDLAGQNGWLELRLESEALQTTGVRAEVLRLQAGTGLEAAALDRSLRWVTLQGPAFTGLLDVQRVRLRRGAAQLTLAGGPGLQGLWARPAPDGRTALELELDHEGNHPFRPLLACTRRYARIRRGHLDLTVRPAGSLRQLAVLLLLGESSLPLLGRFPRGARAAVVFADHADQSSAAKLEALAFGATGAVAAGNLGPQYPGLVNRGLSYTKSVFLRQVRGYARQLDSPEYRQLVQLLQRSGVELALHSPSGGPDPRAGLRRLLAEYRALSPGRTWIDHQPATNCEALSAQGWNPRSPYHSLDLLLAAGLRHFWAGEDVTAAPGSLNLLWPERSASRRPLLYPLALQPAAPGQEAWLFSSASFFLDRDQVARALSEQALLRLEQEHGIFIAHVYLDTFKKPPHRLGRRSLLQLGDGRDRYKLRPEIDEAFRRLAAHQATGRLWVTGVDGLVDHLSGRAAVELRPGQAGELLVRSRAAHRLRALTLRLPGGGRIKLDGAPPAGVQQGEQQSRRSDPSIAPGGELWFDLEPGGTRRLRLPGQPGFPPLLLREQPHD